MDTQTLKPETMEADTSMDFSYSFKSSKSAEDIYILLLQIEKWWMGLYKETITGKSKKIGDEFAFSAGGGAHYTKQRLIELMPNKKIVWEVMESNLQFVPEQKEWLGTKISFKIDDLNGNRMVTFIHKGLTPV